MTPRLAAAACALLAFPPSPAAAAPITFVGTGTFTPGVPTVGCAWNEMRFAGTVVAQPGPAIGPASFDGNGSVCATMLADEGTGVFSGAISGSSRYRRTAFQVTFTGVGIAMTCDLTPTSWNPWTSYVIVCGPGLVVH